MSDARDASDASDAAKVIDSGEPTKDAGPVVCAPQPLPADFMAHLRTVPPAGSCTSSQASAIASGCIDEGAGSTACAAVADTPCGKCGFGLVSGALGPAVLAYYPPGATPPVQMVFDNVSSCLQGVALTETGAAADATRACAVAFDEIGNCEVAACLAYCPVTSPADSAGMNALYKCFGDAEFGTACTTYHATEVSACASQTNAGGTGPLDQCDALLGSSSTPYEQIFNIACGVEDGGV